MTSKTKFIVGGIFAAIVIVALFFIPSNEFLGQSSYNPESPPPIVVLSNYPEDFEINPIRCTVQQDIIEFEFNIVNKLDEDYRLELELILHDKNNQPLSMEAKLIEVNAGETTYQMHQTPYNSDMKSCVIALDRTEKIN